MTGGANARRDQYQVGTRMQGMTLNMRKKKKVDPCLAAPVAPTGLYIDWVDKNTRYHPWWAKCVWAEVLDDVDGFLLSVPIRRYFVEFQRRSPTGTVDTDTRKFYVPAHDNDDNSDVKKMVHIKNRDWDYRFRVRAEVGLLKMGDRSAWSDWSTWSNPADPPPTPTNVQIARASHAVILRWDAPDDPADADIMDRRIAYFIAEVYETESTDPADRDWSTLHKRAKHIHERHHRFHVDTAGNDKTYYYGRVRAVSDDDVKSDTIPATKGGNDTHGTTPSIARPLFHRVVSDFTIQGPLQAKTYKVPKRIDDDYVVRKVVVACHKAGSGGPAHIDVKVNGGGDGTTGYVFHNSDAHDVYVTAGDRSAASADTQELLSRGGCYLEPGDHIRIVVRSIPTTPPEDVTVSVVADRYWAANDTDEGASTGDTGGGGGE